MQHVAITPDDPDFVNALARGLGIITCFGQEREQLTLSEVAAVAGLSRGTARRFLLTLEALGYVRCDGKAFKLAPKTLNLVYAYLSSLPLWKAAQPIMKLVVDELNESCALGVLDDHDVVYIARIPPKHLSFIPVNLGTRMPAHVNAMGQVLLAEFSEPAPGLREGDDMELDSAFDQERPAKFPIAKMRCHEQHAFVARMRGGEVFPADEFREQSFYWPPALELPKVNELDAELLKEFARSLLGRFQIAQYRK